ncbi:hypothetical protein EC991_004734 [Linnemannia zychae]|nr:hypothetical protein EC991_004734 [Linnemannia zychae]
MSSAAVFKIPELRDLLCERLSQSDLCNCVRVSKVWHQAFTPPLWSTISITSSTLEAAFVSTETRAAIRRHRSFIHSFSGLRDLSLKVLEEELLGNADTDFSSPLPLPNNMCTELRELKRSFWQGDCSLLRFVACSPELRALHVGGWGPEDKALIPLIGKLEYLKELTLFASSSSLLPLADFRALLKHCPLSVETLNIDCSLKGDLSNVYAYNSYSSGESQVETAVSSSPQSRLLKHLSLRGSAWNTPGPSVWEPFLSKCHELRSFSVTSQLMKWNVPRIVEVMQQYCPHLEELHLVEVGRHITDDYLAQFLSACDHQPSNDTNDAAGETEYTDRIVNSAALGVSLASQLHEQEQQQTGVIQERRRPQWKVIELTKLPHVGPLSSEVLLAHTPTLETVIVQDGATMPSTLQHQLLAQCPNLATFKVIPDWTDREWTFCLDPLLLIPSASSIQDSIQWACELTLRTLFIAIRPATLTSEQQRAVLRQFGRLHNLEELLVYNECDRGNNGIDQEGFTNWSLANGLDEMIGMQKLRIVSLSGFTTEFGDAERRWAYEHWPLLEGMYLSGTSVKALE